MGTSLTASAKSTVKTKVLILSDTHGTVFDPEHHPRQLVDVAIHCGDLTNESKIEEFRTTIKLLRQMQAPLKLVIPGNHDFTLDIPVFKKRVSEAQPTLEPDIVVKEYGGYGEAKSLFGYARESGVLLLEEGTHRFILKNGATLTVYARPYTPSLGDWGFQFYPQHGHAFALEDGTDIVITHGPPEGILDRTETQQRAGCSDPFAAIARARPRLHCFGHIHEGWGAKLVTRRDHLREQPSHSTDIDNGKSVVIEKLFNVRKWKYDTSEMSQEKTERTKRYARQKCCHTSHCHSDEYPLEVGKQTLFVNAAIQGDEDNPRQLPWLVDINLPKVYDTEGAVEGQ